MKKIKNYIIEITVKQEFFALKDIEASSKQEAINKAKNIAIECFSRELHNDIWSELGDPKVVSTSIEDECPL